MLSAINFETRHRVLSAGSAQGLNEAIEKHESNGWKALPDTFRVSGTGNQMYSGAYCYSVMVSKTTLIGAGDTPSED